MAQVVGQPVESPDHCLCGESSLYRLLHADTIELSVTAPELFCLRQWAIGSSQRRYGDIRSLVHCMCHQRTVLPLIATSFLSASIVYCLHVVNTHVLLPPSAYAAALALGYHYLGDFDNPGGTLRSEQDLRMWVPWGAHSTPSAIGSTGIGVPYALCWTHRPPVGNNPL